MFGLNDKVVFALRSIFAAGKEIDKVVIYGSRAKGNYREGSDIDLVFYGENLTLDIMFEIEEKIEELNLPYMFDNSIFNRIDNENLVAHIERIGKVFYVSGNK